jgi:hypothetical protein
MAKKTRDTPVGSVESAALGFAEDLGRLLGTAQSKAEDWLGQRKAIAVQLAQIRDTASKYLQELTGEGAKMAAAVQRGRRGRPAGSKNKVKRGPGRPAGTGRKRKMSAAARKAISDAQKARWAKQKKAKTS